MADSDRSALEDARKRARRRLVGAIVLVLIAAVVLPMFLETDPKPLGPDVQLQIPPIDDGKFQNRLTPEPKGAVAKGEVRPGPSTAPVVDVKREPASATSDATGAAAGVPLGSTAGSAAGVSGAPKMASSTGSADTGKAATPAPDKATTAPDKAAPAAAKVEPPAPAKSSAPAPSPSPSPSVSPAAADKADAASPNQPVPAAKGVPNGAFVIQLGAFAGLPVAVELADKARDMGYPVFLEKVTTTSGPVHRVRVGPYATLGQAQADAVKLKLAGITADVRKR